MAAVIKHSVHTIKLVYDGVRAVHKIVRPEWAIFWRYAKVELTPPTISDLGDICYGTQRIVLSVVRGTFRQVTIRQAWLNTLVAIEVGSWYYMGECIGKWHIVGYNV